MNAMLSLKILNLRVSEKRTSLVGQNFEKRQSAKKIKNEEVFLKIVGTLLIVITQPRLKLLKLPQIAIFAVFFKFESLKK
jgi:hypothetical protein